MGSFTKLAGFAGFSDYILIRRGGIKSDNHFSIIIGK